jgi:hypothetical protein
MKVDKVYNHLAYFLFYNYLKECDIMGVPKGSKRRKYGLQSFESLDSQQFIKSASSVIG